MPVLLLLLPSVPGPYRRFFMFSLAKAQRFVEIAIFRRKPRKSHKSIMFRSS
jgi:hypothetical protein